MACAFFLPIHLSFSTKLLLYIVIGAARHLVQHFRQSPKAMAALRQKYALSRNADDLQSINLIMDTPTRWNSTYKMLKVLCRHQFIVRLILNDESVTPHRPAAHLELRDSHWIIIQKLVELLEPMKVSEFLRSGSLTPHITFALQVGLQTRLPGIGTALQQDTFAIACFGNVFVGLHKSADH